MSRPQLTGTLTQSLANKTVVQLRPKSTTGNSFCWSISGTFVGGMIHHPLPAKKNPFRVSWWVNNCLCPFMLNISLILLHK